MTAPLKILYFGLPLGALLLAADGHEIVHAAICRKDAPGLRRLRRRLPGRVSVLPRVDAPFLAARAAEGPALVVSWFWTKKLPPAALTLAPLGAFGVHPSLLPRHRGPDPYYAALRAGDRETGVTAHRLEAEYDTGALLGSLRISIDPAWNAWRLAKALDRPSLALLRQTARAFAAGTPPREVPQDPALVTEAPAPTDDELALDLRAPVDALLRHVRAAAPWPGAFLTVGDATVTVTAARAATLRLPLAPGEAARCGDTILLGAGDGLLELVRARVEREDGDDEPEERAGASLAEALFPGGSPVPFRGAST